MVVVNGDTQLNDSALIMDQLTQQLVEAGKFEYQLPLPHCMIVANSAAVDNALAGRTECLWWCWAMLLAVVLTVRLSCAAELCCWQWC